MAGLYMIELIMRADARRSLVVAPGSLVEQWRDELFEKFGLEFPIYSPLLEQASPSGNPFENYQQLIVRLDQLSRNEELEKLCAAGWDLAVFLRPTSWRRTTSEQNSIKRLVFVLQRSLGRMSGTYY